ncbi:four helix bundle protein [Candidatus Campbellbacteria bacterium CG22_combo_CG10-13_8_21_14_all_36_13]|uniref:Four helix bundle protein n=1 Tax=Candidatus Campbellbacteria bacterium CG22_combo_CG10-13_8_21_14_all_36_13 TaxID=1974529 RepID=A0A2H0DZ83_9BACT|nr:MAG: four helix bundle protein [Candidatus Campbellbacteria bacterium CG22_combo_CG10-13_8_21_14_all_36_13]
MTSYNKIKTFTDLEAWKTSHRLVLCIYKVTKTFPKEEIFGLVSQLRRAGVSITSNIAEGFSRKTKKDKEHFYLISIGSLKEVESQLILSKDLGYVSDQDYIQLRELMAKVSMLLYGLQKSAVDKI